MGNGLRSGQFLEGVEDPALDGGGDDAEFPDQAGFVHRAHLIEDKGRRSEVRGQRSEVERPEA